MWLTGVIASKIVISAKTIIKLNIIQTKKFGQHNYLKTLYIKFEMK